MPQIVPYEYINIYISELIIIMIIIWRMRNKEIRGIIRNKIIRIYIKRRKEW